MLVFFPCFFCTFPLCYEDDEEAFTVECNNQIEAENSSHQALKRAWEQLSFRIRYDKSKIIRTRYETELKSKIFKLVKIFVRRNNKNPLYQIEKLTFQLVVGVVVQFAVQVCLQVRFPVVVWGPACSGITLGWVWCAGLVCTRVSHWVWCCTRASHWAVHHWIPLGAGSWCCQRHHSAIAVAPLQLGMDKPCVTNFSCNN